MSTMEQHKRTNRSINLVHVTDVAKSCAEAIFKHIHLGSSPDEIRDAIKSEVAATVIAAIADDRARKSSRGKPRFHSGRSEAPTGFVPIPGYEGLYSMSNAGEIFSLRVGRVMRVTKNPLTGYVQIKLRDIKTNPSVRLVHQLVMETFVGTPPDGHVPHHKNHVRDDNRLENLEYLSGSDNSHNTTRSGVTHRFRGIVKLNQKTTPWAAVISRNGKTYWNRGFSTQEQAASAYDEMAESLFGRNAVTNKTLGLL